MGSSHSGEIESNMKGGTNEEMRLLDHLLQPFAEGNDNGGGAKGNAGDFILDFFDTREDEAKFVKNAETASKEEEKVIRIDASKRDRKSVDKIMGELSVKEKKKKPKGDELLDLMDKT